MSTPIDPARIALALEMHATGKFAIADILAATGISRSTLYRHLARSRLRDADKGDSPTYAPNAEPMPPSEGKVIPATGTRRICAQPNWEYFHHRLQDDRVLELKHVYAEYEEACRIARQKPYAFSSFAAGLSAWKRSMLESEQPRWLPGECMLTYWARLDVCGARHWAFVAQMAFSDATFVFRSDGQSPRHWMECCLRAFRFFGAVPHITDCSVFGASKGGVSRCVRATLEGFAAYYRTVLFGARPKTGKTAQRIPKPLAPKNGSFVLRSIRHDLVQLANPTPDRIDETIEKALRFYNETRFEGHPDRWSLLTERERPNMLALPETPYDMATWDFRILSNDYHFVLDGARYSCPYSLANQEVRIRYTPTEVIAFHGGAEVARHAILAHDTPGKRISTDNAHRPSAHRWFAKRIDYRFTAMAETCGPATVRVMKILLARCKSGQTGFAPCKRLIDLRHSPSPIPLETACRQALQSSGPITLQTIESLMQGTSARLSP